MGAEDPTDRSRRLFADTEREPLAYALRRVDRAEDAADVLDVNEGLGCDTLGVDLG